MYSTGTWHIGQTIICITGHLLNQLYIYGTGFEVNCTFCDEEGYMWYWLYLATCIL